MYTIFTLIVLLLVVDYVTNDAKYTKAIWAKIKEWGGIV